MLCGCPERFGDGTALYSLPKNRFAYFVRDELPGHSRDAIASWHDKALSRWTAVADIEARRIMSLSELADGEIVNEITVDDLGDDGTLADQIIASRGRTHYRMRLNSRIRWVETNGVMQPGTADPVRTMAHEEGHFFGLLHFSTSLPKELMEPRILQDIIGPQPTEAKIVSDWFGKPKTQAQPAPGSPPWEFRVNSDGTAVVKRHGVLQRLSPSPFSGS